MGWRFNLRKSDAASAVILRASILSVLAKGGGMALWLLVLGLGVSRLGKEGFGQLVTLQAINATSLLFDIGLGQGLINRAAQMGARRNADLRQLTSTAFYGSWLLAALVLGIAAIGTGVISGRANTFRWGAFATAACMAANLPLSIAVKLETGFQKYEPIYLFQISGTILAAACFILAMRARAGLIPAILSILAPPLLALIANNCWCFLLAHPELRPSAGLVSSARTRELLATGIQPFIAQGCSAVIFVAPVWSIHAHAGAAAAGTYGAIARLLSIPVVLVSLTTAPLWPILARLLAQGGRREAERLARNAVWAVGGLGIVVFPLLGAASPYLLHALTGAAYPISRLTLLVAGLCLAISVRQTIVMAVLGAGASRCSTAAFLGGCLVGVILPIAGGLRLSPETIAITFMGVETVVLGSAGLDLRLAWRAPRSAPAGLETRRTVENLTVAHVQQAAANLSSTWTQPVG